LGDMVMASFQGVSVVGKTSTVGHGKKRKKKLWKVLRRQKLWVRKNGSGYHL
jgi:hypothetical protein